MLSIRGQKTDNIFLCKQVACYYHTGENRTKRISKGLNEKGAKQGTDTIHRDATELKSREHFVNLYKTDKDYVNVILVICGLDGTNYF